MLEEQIDIIENMLCTLLTKDQSGFQSCLFLLSLLTVDKEFNQALLEKTDRVFEVLSLSISENICRYSKILSFCVMSNLCLQSAHAKKLYQREGVLRKLKEFLCEEHEHFSREELFELVHSLSRVMSKKQLLEFFKEQEAHSGEILTLLEIENEDNLTALMSFALL